MSIAELIEATIHAADSPDHVGKEERLELRMACERLSRSLESPMEATFRFGFAVLSSQPHRAMPITGTDTYRDTSQWH